MAYVPPHKRPTSKNDDGNHEGSSSQTPLPKPAFPPFLIKEKNLKHKSAARTTSTTAHYRGPGYKYDGIFRWFAVGLDDHNHLPPSVHLHSVSGKNLIHGKISERQVLYCDSDESFTRRPWEYIAEDVLQGLLSSFAYIRDTMNQNHVKVTSDVIARIGKVLFFSGPSYYGKKIEEDSLRPRRSSFYTNIPESYVEYLINEGASKSGLEFEKEKEVYRVYIEHDHTRYMLTDISCLEKNLDMRLDLATKRTKSVLTDEDMQSLKDLISSAIVDTNLKIGLRWPLENTESGNKFYVAEVWRITQKTFKCPSLTLQIRDVFRSTSEEAKREVAVKFKGLTSELLKEDADRNLISEMLKDDLKVLWDNVLCCERFPKEISLG
ncbi:uncharacterized protein LOC133790604 isoform X2 [Humulus lupulus]|uniref:uncharacterized protein LOC133790604 isoform X2 n=1 Tax=Humulus lupulus TaxID=3486 RepID=UPI002B410122|nr:uncharacterized protein LOC133790604 isoform X2 [Humulus lupulus]